jgi:hypothetical protein
MPGFVKSPLTVVTTPTSAWRARTSRTTAAVACRTKLLYGPPAKAMPPVMVGVPARSRPKARCWTLTAAGKQL